MQLSNEYLSRVEAAKYIGVTLGTIRTFATTKRHLLPYIKRGKTVHYLKNDLDKYLEKITIYVG